MTVKKILGLVGVVLILIIGMSVVLAGTGGSIRDIGGSIEGMGGDDDASVVVALEHKQSGVNYEDEITIYKNNQTLGEMEFRDREEFEISPGTYTITVEAYTVEEDDSVNVLETEITVEEDETVIADHWGSPE